MKTITFSIFLCCTFFSSFAQNIDSLSVVSKIDSLIDVNTVLVEQRKFEEALEVIETAKSLAKEAFGNDHEIYANCAFNHGRTFHKIPNYSESEILYLEAKALFENNLGKEHSTYVIILENLAILYWDMGKLLKAEPLLLEAMNIRGEDHDRYAGILENLAILNFELGNFKKSEQYFLQIKELNEKTYGKEHSEYAITISNLSNLYSRTGRHEEALQLLLEAVKINEKQLGKEHPEYANNLNNLGILYYKIGEYDLAEKHYLQAKEIWGNTLGEEHPAYTNSLNNLGILYYMLGRYEATEAIYTETLNLRKKVLGQEHPEYTRSLNNLGILKHRLGQYEEAELLYLENLAIKEKAFGKEHPDYASSLHNLASLYKSIGRYKEAKKLINESISIREKTLGKEHAQYASSLNALAVLHLTNGQYDLAEPLFLESISINEKTLGKEHPDYAQSINTLALLYRDSGRYELADSLYNQAITIREMVLGKEHPSYAESIHDFAFSKKMQNEYDSAEKLYLIAKNIREKVLGKEHLHYTYSLNGLANLYWRTKEFEKAKQYSNESIDIQKSLLLRASKSLSEREMDAFINKSISSLNGTYSFTHIQRETDFGSPEVCFDNSLFYKGFLVTSSSQMKKHVLKDTVSIEKFDLFKSYHRRLAKEFAKPLTEQKNVEELEAKANQIEKELVQNVAGFSEAIQRVYWQDIQKKLEPDEAAIEFIHYPFYNPDLTDSIMYAALVLQLGDTIPVFIPLFEEDQLNSLLLSDEDNNEEFLGKLYTSRGVVPRKKKQQEGLYQLVWEPLDNVLEGVEKIYFSPSGLLHRIAFNAIPSEDGFLSDKYELVQLTSTRNLIFRNSNENYILSEAMVYGGIEYSMDSSSIATANLSLKKLDFVFNLNDYNIAERGSKEESWQYLPGSEDELIKISNLFETNSISTKSIKGYQATEESFKSIGENTSSPTVLHIATHGFFFPDSKIKNMENLELAGSGFRFSENPLIRSGLIMAGANAAWQGKPIPKDFEDGILTAYEISNLNLSSTKLVVLSACETGLGDIQGSEGVFGLQRAFKMAGVKNIIMSLWQVPDEQTGELMEYFYSFWLNGESINKAFNKAQKQMRKKYNDPYYWAGFVLIE